MVVGPHAMLTIPVADKFLQLVPRGYSQIPQFLSGIQNQEFSEGPSINLLRELGHRFSQENPLCLFLAEGLYHFSG